MKKLYIASTVILAFAVIGGWFYGRPAYRQYKEKRFLYQARQFMAENDYKSASLSIRQALLLKRTNLEALRMRANLAQISHSPLVVDCWRDIVEAEPTIENKLRLASAAVEVEGPPWSSVAQVLQDIGGSAANVPSYHVIAAELALKQHRLADAAAHFEAASRLEPTNQMHQLELAVLRLESTNSDTAAQARATLEGVAANTNLAAVALRWLIGDSLRRKDLAEAERFSHRLISDPNCVLADRLQHAAILQQNKNPAAESYLESVQKICVTNPLEIYTVSSWMLRHGMIDEAPRWLSTLAPGIRGEQPVPVASVECFLARKDWAGLEAFLQDQKWDERDFLRLAFLSRAAFEQKQSLAAEARWRAAVREAGEQFGPLMALLQMAKSWGHDRAKEELLWLIGQRFPREKWAFQELHDIYIRANNTRGLNRLSSTMVSYNPTNIMAQNDLAATDLLLKANLSRAYELASEVYNQHPDDPTITSTYAYSLHVQSRTKEGLAALEKLKPEALENPSIALYYGLLLAASGETNKASRFLELAHRARLWPEEQSLLAEAGK
jgi:predicted Zn-dependent protease